MKWKDKVVAFNSFLFPDRLKTPSLSWSGAHPSRRSCWYDDDGGDDGVGGDDGGGDNVGGGDAKQNNNEDLPGTKLFSSKFLHPPYS